MTFQWELEYLLEQSAFAEDSCCNPPPGSGGPDLIVWREVTRFSTIKSEDMGVLGTMYDGNGLCIKAESKSARGGTRKLKKKQRSRQNR
ncbi:hypothetical protein SLEP1_g35913 [Rubroshorea leprosula]|uniref:Uncharacterized protein n=1 Tax=Rubroshorea leprosula TaxID=152421 RepID=A0AAV5KPW8_9ROSI|nr:hypothetical protein SLEP1_g35913 [Rubroshorea leprosula]